MFITFLFGLTVLLGTLIILSFKRQKKISELSISTAFSVLFCLIFLEVIPHTLEHINYFEMIIYALIGLVLLKLLDIFIPDHEHSNHKEHDFHIGIMSSIALIIHNLIEGMILYSTLNKLRFSLIVLLIIGFITTVVGFREFFSLTILNLKMFIFILILVSVSTIIFSLMSIFVDKLIKKYPRLFKE